jgi:hypothetical protein
MTKREECFELFNSHPDVTRERAIALAISKAGVTKTTAGTYYPAWRKDFVSKQGYVTPAKTGKQENVKNITEVAAKSITKTVNTPESKPTFDEMKDAIKDIKIVDTVNEPIIPDIDIAKIVSDAFAKAKKDFVEKSEVITANAMKCESEKTEKSISEIKENINIVQKEREGINWKAEALKPVEVAEELFEVTRLIPVVMKGTHGSYHFGKDGVKATLHEELISKEKMDEALEALEIWERCYGKDGIQSC